MGKIGGKRGWGSEWMSGSRVGKRSDRRQSNRLRYRGVMLINLQFAIFCDEVPVHLVEQRMLHHGTDINSYLRSMRQVSSEAMYYLP